ncbi:cyclin-dependent kinase-like 2 [Hypomesus transpacificus]|uniref:cyclin-dependent kinase-like 2 n=1 Tax=Hypomesus transpacificus TaxID=137520 RepID=UPI001F07B246|nr:cyclin-dependent kinase-like 2 [Hypomesus transpacificus]
MDKYENLGQVGEGSYGVVMKCRHKETGRIVAVKKFLDTEEDLAVRKIALREIRMLKQLQHVNLVRLLGVFRRRRRVFLVFEFVERNLLEELEQNPCGLGQERARRYLYQTLRALCFCHQHHILHRDVKPENLLVSEGGVVKLCDFGFARTLAEGAEYTEYVATRWYRPPELLVGDTLYGKPVDVWAAGCVCVEMLTGEPLFPGDSDIDQLYHIIRCFGNLTPRHQEVFHQNPVFSGLVLPQVPPVPLASHTPLQLRYPALPWQAVDLTQKCLQMDPDSRSSCSDLMLHQLFTSDQLHLRLEEELNMIPQKENRKSRREEGDNSKVTGRDSDPSGSSSTTNPEHSETRTSPDVTANTTVMTANTTKTTTANTTTAAKPCKAILTSQPGRDSDHMTTSSMTTSSMTTSSMTTSSMTTTSMTTTSMTTTNKPDRIPEGRNNLDHTTTTMMTNTSTTEPTRSRHPDRNMTTTMDTSMSNMTTIIEPKRHIDHKDTKTTTTDPRIDPTTTRPGETDRTTCDRVVTVSTLPPAPTPSLSHTSLTPVVNGNSPFTHSNSGLGAWPHLGTLSLRSIDKTKRHINPFSRISLQCLSTHSTASTQAVSERSFLSDRDRGDRGDRGVAMVRKRAEVSRSEFRFPELRTPLLSEGKHPKGTSKNLKKDVRIPAITTTTTDTHTNTHALQRTHTTLDAHGKTHTFQRSHTQMDTHTHG